MANNRQQQKQHYYIIWTDHHAIIIYWTNQTTNYKKKLLIYCVTHTYIINLIVWFIRFFSSVFHSSSLVWFCNTYYFLLFSYRFIACSKDINLVSIFGTFFVIKIVLPFVYWVYRCRNVMLILVFRWWWWWWFFLILRRWFFVWFLSFKDYTLLIFSIKILLILISFDFVRFNYFFPQK